MSVKPIDLQTNIAHMHEIAKGEESKSAAVAESQHLREKESEENSKLVNTRLNENKKIEKIAIKREEEKKKRAKKKGKGVNPEDQKKDGEEISVDNKLGIIIDIRK